MKVLKIILPIALVLIALLATFFLAPLSQWKEDKKLYPALTYAGFCALWWKKKIKGDEYENTLPEITVTPN